jgi:hypothetical protein
MSGRVVGELGVVGAAERANQFRFQALRVAVEHMNFDSLLRPHHRRGQADRARAGDQRAARLPAFLATADTLHVLPSFRHDARRLEQHAQ